MRLALAAIALAAALPALASAQTYPVKIPSSGGEVIIPAARDQRSYDKYGYAPARRVGDTLYVSGAVAGPAPGEATDAAAFEAQIRRAFKQLDVVLKASGASFDDVAMINSFHVWDGPYVSVGRFEQVEIINKVKADYIKGAHPAWSAIGSSGLLDPRGVVEIQLIAHVPPKG